MQVKCLTLCTPKLCRYKYILIELSDLIGFGYDLSDTQDRLILFVCFVALRPKSTAMVIAGRSVHLTTLFSGQA